MVLQIIKNSVYKLFILAVLLTLTGPVFSQSLEDLLNSDTETGTKPVLATFKSTRILNGHSIERMQKKQLDFRISHRFERINRGAYDLFGLDQALIHLSLEYGANDWLMVGFGRGNVEKTFDGFMKFSILRQSSGVKEIPFHLSYLASSELVSQHWSDPERDFNLKARLSYVHQLLLARKFNDAFSFQITPTFVHRNIVPTAAEKNDLFALGAGLRLKLSKRISLNGEYFYVHRVNELPEINYYNPLALGIDIQTGGHVFQLILTNSRSMREGGFIGKTTGNWLDGDIHFGFNVSRVFSL